jgi:hypothetical protein
MIRVRAEGDRPTTGARTSVAGKQVAVSIGGVIDACVVKLAPDPRERFVLAVADSRR